MNTPTKGTPGSQGSQGQQDQQPQQGQQGQGQQGGQTQGRRTSGQPSHVQHEGRAIDLDVARASMDEELITKIEESGQPQTDQEWFDAYQRAHLQKHGQAFKP